MSGTNNNKTRSNILKVGGKNLDSKNWEAYHPNGTHMFTCGEKKATWYLDRNLAKRTAEGKIMLTFEPKGTGFEPDEVFGKAVRETICVVTGNPDELQRHHIVPYCYRSYFPKQYKSKNHHDVVLINHKKHSDYEIQATKYKDVIAEMYGVKTINEFNLEYIGSLREVGKTDAILLNNLHSLFKTHNKISDDVKMEKLKQISNHTGFSLKTVSNYSYIQHYKLYVLVRDNHMKEQYNFKQNKRMLYDHGYHVVQKLDTEEKIMNFVKLWRTHFIETMKPKFMPTGWSIDFRVKTNI